MRTRLNRTAGNLIVTESTPLEYKAEVERIVVAKYKAAIRRGEGRMIGGQLVISRVGERCRIVEVR